MRTRQIILDTETTGLETAEGHRIIEIAAVEMINRRLTKKHFHVYLNPERELDAGAIEVHGLTTEFLKDKPKFADIVEEFLNFVTDAELVIHNAPFDIGFLNYELSLLPNRYPLITEHCTVVDTLVLARRKHPGQRNNLDALCQRYKVDNSNRELHGALLDSELLAQVYLLMTGGQAHLFQEDEAEGDGVQRAQVVPHFDVNREPLAVIAVSSEEKVAHEALLEKIQKSSGKCVWRES